MWNRRKSKSLAIRMALVELGPDVSSEMVVVRLAKRRVRVRPNHINKIKMALRKKDFWAPETQQGLRRAQKFIRDMGSVERARDALLLAAWIEPV